MGSKPSKKKDDKQEVKDFKKEKVKKSIEGVSGIVRIGERDIDGHKKVGSALLGIKGIGHSVAHALPIITGIDANVMIGSLKEEDIAKLEDAVKNLPNTVPSHILNRRKDVVTGQNSHVTASNLILTRKEDIDFMKKIQCYKGVRHQMGQPVRGQRTRSSFRTGERMGVIKKKEAPAKAGESKGEGKSKAGSAPKAAAPKAEEKK